MRLLGRDWRSSGAGEKPWNALFAIALAVAFTVTALQEIPERWWLGHPIGVFVSALAYAYAGAWIFHWVIVARPRRKQLRNIYAIIWPALSLTARDGSALVRDLIYMADPDLIPEPEDADIGEIANKILVGPLPHLCSNHAVPLINTHLELSSTRMGTVASLLALVEHDLMLAIAKVNASGLVMYHADPHTGENADGTPIPVV